MQVVKTSRLATPTTGKASRRHLRHVQKAKASPRARAKRARPSDARIEHDDARFLCMCENIFKPHGSHGSTATKNNPFPGHSAV